LIKASVGPAKKKKIELAWTHTEKKRGQHCQTSSTMDTARPRPRKKRMTKEQLEKRSQERNADRMFQVQLVENKDRAGWRQVVVM